MLREAKWSPLHDRRKAARLTLFFKIVQEEVKGVPANDLAINNSKTRAGSSRLNYRYITGNTQTYLNSFFPRTIKDWNKLSDEIKTRKTGKAFKASLPLKIY